MKPLVDKIKPASGYSNVLHLGLLLVLPTVLFILVWKNFIPLAFLLVLLSKWRMLAVRPHFWLANIRANSVDIVVGLSLLILTTHSTSLIIQLFWMALFAVWLVFIKPGTGVLMTSIQSAIGLLTGLVSLYVSWSAGPLYGLVFLTGLICYLSARHFFDSFDEPYAKLLAYVWGYFGAALLWVLGHWLIFYGSVAQPTVLLVTIGYGLGALYYLDHFDRLTSIVRRQFLIIMLAIVVVVLTFSNWGDKIV